MKRYLHAAYACALFPLVGSVLIYVLWLGTGTPWGQALMWALLFVSVVALPVGVLALVIYAGLPDEDGERTRGQLIRHVTLAGLLLIVGPLTCYLLAQHIRAQEEGASAIGTAARSNAPGADAASRLDAPARKRGVAIECAGQEARHPDSLNGGRASPTRTRRRLPAGVGRAADYASRDPRYPPM